MFQLALENNDIINATISQIRSLKVRNSVSSFVTIFNGRKNVLTVSQMTLQEITNLIQKHAGNSEKYGEITFKNVLKDYEYHHRIEILREDGTAHQELCPLCGNLRQVYHSNRCSCKVKMPFLGKFSKDKKTLTKQVVNLDLRDFDPIQFQELCDKHGGYKKEKPVSNIKWDDEFKIITGSMEIKKGIGITVYTDEVQNLNDLKETRYNWFRIEDERIEELYK